LGEKPKPLYFHPYFEMGLGFRGLGFRGLEV